MKSVQEIQAEHGRNAAEIMNSYLDTMEEIRETRELEAGGYLDRLTGEQRMTLLTERKTERAREATNQAREDYAAEMERHQEELSCRVDCLKGRLFGVEDAGALSRAALATDAELGTLMEIALPTLATQS